MRVQGLYVRPFEPSFNVTSTNLLTGDSTADLFNKVFLVLFLSHQMCSLCPVV